MFASWYDEPELSTSDILLPKKPNLKLEGGAHKPQLEDILQNHCHVPLRNTKIMKDKAKLINCSKLKTNGCDR
jgi:hypothetical protein